MSISTPFIRRPVATTLLTAGLALAGGIAFFSLPVSPVPDVDIPTISVSAQLPGASPDTVATSVTTPLERHLGTIAGVTEMTSVSTVGSARIILQFDLSRNIDGAARDVEAGIQAARADLPTTLRNNPSYNKFNPADSPVMILALTSDTLTTGQIYNQASTILEQKLLQLPGVGEVDLGGSSLPAVRVELNPRALFRYGIGLEDVRAALSAANANSSKGFLEDPSQHYQLYVNDTAETAAAYRPLIIAYRNNDPVRLRDVATVTDGVENLRNLGLADGKAAVLLIIHKQPGANIIQVDDGIRTLLPQLQASIPLSIHISEHHDRTTTIRASLHDVEFTLLLSTLLVIFVVYVALRNPRAALIPAVAVPVSLIGTFGAMYLLGFSLDNMSLMALTIATGFVVDDAIVMLENISRHREEGMPVFEAALLGAREVGFTVLAMSLSLIAVFLPILLMGGIVGRVFREFAITLSISILLSLVISLTTTPMMCAHLLGSLHAATGSLQDRFLHAMERGLDAMRRLYARTLRVALAHPAAVMLVLAGTVGLNFYLFDVIPKGFFPQEDTGAVQGNLRADQDVSFDAMSRRLREAMAIVRRDPAVQSVVGYTGQGSGGGGAENTASMFIDLKPLSERKINAERVIARLRGSLSRLTGAQLFLQVVQDLRAGGRQSNAQYQYTILADDQSELDTWAPRITEALKHVPELEDVNSDRQSNGLDVRLDVDRDTAARMDINMSNIDNTLYDAFGQRLVSTIYNEMNQYYVIMEVEPDFWQSPGSLLDMWISTSGGALSGTQSTAAAVGDFSISQLIPSTLYAPGQSALGSTAPFIAGASTATSSSAAGGAPAGTLGGVTLVPGCSSSSATASTSTASALSSGGSTQSGEGSVSIVGSTVSTTISGNSSSSATSASNTSGSVTYGSQPPATNCTSSTTAENGSTAGSSAPTSTSSSSTTSLNLAAQNAQQNALTNSGRGAASTGASLSTSEETMVPLAAMAHYGPSVTPMQVMHQEAFVATTISFNLPVGEALGTATQAIDRTLRELHVPVSIHGAYAGTAQVFQQTLANEAVLILAAIAAVYVVLGILYESFVHPLTILSTLPSGGVGAVLALLLFNTEFSLVALIGVFLLIGIVKKNAIMMIDVAIDIERRRLLDAREAIHEACLLRFRPIMMTTFAALFGSIPLAVTAGNGAEFRQPLGISIVGGLLVSQVLTLYTTPVVYLCLDRVGKWVRLRLQGRSAEDPAAASGLLTHQ